MESGRGKPRIHGRGLRPPPRNWRLDAFPDVGFDLADVLAKA
jgi:hypothetical protein